MDERRRVRSELVSVHAMNLTPKHLEVLKRIGAGQGNKEIAAAFGWHISTVDHYWRKLQAALGFKHRWQAIHYAIRTGLTPILFMLTLVCSGQAPALPVLGDSSISELLPPEVVVTPQQSVSLAWDRPSDVGVKGYWIYYGWVSRTYTNSVNVGNVTNAPLIVPNGADYFAATAYDASGAESDFSNEARYVPVIPPPGKTNLWLQFARQFAPTVNGPWTVDTNSILNLTNPVGNRFARERITETHF